MEPCHQEEWRTIPEFENYEVSESGQIRRRLPGNRTRPGRIKQPQVNSWGYLFLVLRLDGKGYAVKVHSLVAAAFIGPQPLGHDVHHKDFTKLNNHHSNLEYIPRCLHGHNGFKGEKNPNSKLTESDVLQMRKLRKEGWQYPDLVNQFGMPKRSIKRIVKGISWGHLPL